MWFSAMAFLAFRSIEGLRDLLSHRKREVRLEAIGALLAKGARAASATSALVRASLLDEDERVRDAALYAAREVGGQQAVREILARLKDRSARTRCAALWALGRVGSPSVTLPTFVIFLDDPERSVRERAADELRLAGPDARN
ncbi:MAG: hypothetical protein A2V98_08890, partial [Planctomycetes bacterium RBG_16_64_12]